MHLWTSTTSRSLTVRLTQMLLVCAGEPIWRAMLELARERATRRSAGGRRAAVSAAAGAGVEVSQAGRRLRRHAQPAAGAAGGARPRGAVHALAAGGRGLVGRPAD